MALENICCVLKSRKQTEMDPQGKMPEDAPIF